MVNHSVMWHDIYSVINSYKYLCNHDFKYYQS